METIQHRILNNMDFITYFYGFHTPTSFVLAIIAHLIVGVPAIYLYPNRITDTIA